MYGKTIKLFLIDGEPNSRMSCELSNWTGKAYKIPRNSIKICSDRTDLNNTGVYMLFGKSPEEKTSGMVYIGEADGILNRLTQHLKEKDFWQDAIVIISKDENLNKAHVKYLEHRLYDIAKKVDRYTIVNTQIPSRPSISEADESEMEEFLANIKILVNTLGYKLFEDLRKSVTIKKDEDITFYIKAVRGADGFGKPTPDGFVVFKDSQIALTVTSSYFEAMAKLRQKLIDEGILIQQDNKIIFAKDYLFSSASSAAMIVMGRAANGLAEWKLKDGSTLKDYEAN